VGRHVKESNAQHKHKTEKAQTPQRSEHRTEKTKMTGRETMNLPLQEERVAGGTTALGSTDTLSACICLWHRTSLAAAKSD
jgi:hypothetical protein